MPNNQKKNSNVIHNDDMQIEDARPETARQAFFKLSNFRINAVIVIFLGFVIILAARLFFLQVVEAEENKQNAIDTRTINYSITPKRGTIYDRNGNVLAFSKDATTVYANPSEINNVKDTAEKLSLKLGGKSSDYIDLISDHDKKFVYIKRRIDNDVAEKLKEEKLEGIYFKEDSKREYPYGKDAGQIIGACNIDGDGLCGLELYYDDILRGSAGNTIKQQGNYGMPIPGGVVEDRPVIDGQDIMISIDIEIQQKVEQVLESYNSKLGSKNMNAIVMDPRNGEIYAAASLPLFNPADIINAPEGSTDLKCISSTYEPGSTFKTIAATAILENNAMSPDTQIYCPDTIAADEYWVSDAHKRGDQSFSLKQIIARSSNVGISLATEKLGFDKFYDKIIKYNLNENTGIDFPGDTSGYLKDCKNWSKIQSYNVSFGQGVTITPMQLTRFYCALANSGLEPTPHFLMRYLQTNKDVEYSQTDVIQNKSAIPLMNDMLRSVVVDGTGKLAEIEKYGVVGKTGTGEMADVNGKYLKDTYFSSFVGFLSQASEPITCFIGAERVPSEAGVTQAYKDIMTFVIERLRIVPQG